MVTIVRFNHIFLPLPDLEADMLRVHTQDQVLWVWRHRVLKPQSWAQPEHQRMPAYALPRLVGSSPHPPFAGVTISQHGTVVSIATAIPNLLRRATAWPHRDALVVLAVAVRASIPVTTCLIVWTHARPNAAVLRRLASAIHITTTVSTGASHADLPSRLS
jgi:hypothetical protein